LSEARNKLVNKSLYDKEKIERAFNTAQSAFAAIEGTRLDHESDSYPVNPEIFKGVLGIAETSGELCEAMCNVMLHDYDFKICYNILNELNDIDDHQTIIRKEIEKNNETT